MNLQEAANHCETAWANYAAENGVSREGDAFYVLKLQEELGELVRSLLERQGKESRRKNRDEQALHEKLKDDCVSMVGNALIAARYFGVTDIEAAIQRKFPVKH